MGGQACVFYGAAEFSRDLDLVILPDPQNLDRLRAALADLQASPVAVPSMDGEVLARGHAVHFRCSKPDVAGLRIDVMSRLRGVAPFDQLWDRRTTIEVDGDPLDLLSLPDLVLAKKTQSGKDWPMIRRLVEQSFYSTEAPSPEAVAFWLRELRSPELFVDLAARFPADAAHSTRESVRLALTADLTAVEEALAREQQAERAADRAYWEPLRRELEQLCGARRHRE